MRTSALFGAKNLRLFEIFSVSARTKGQGVQPVRTFCGQGGRGKFLWFCAEVFYGRPLMFFFKTNYLKNGVKINIIHIQAWQNSMFIEYLHLQLIIICRKKFFRSMYSVLSPLLCLCYVEWFCVCTAFCNVALSNSTKSCKFYLILWECSAFRDRIF